MGVLIVDDSDPNVIYSGEWQSLLGSTRQWDGTVHTTFQTGASASVSFQATTVTVIATIPPGSGQQALVDIQLDSMEPVRVTMTSSAAAVYADAIWISPGILSEEVHTITLTNRGGGNDLDFSFDRLKLESNSFEPKVLAPQAGPIIPTPSISTFAQLPPTPQSNSESSSVPSSSTGAGGGGRSKSNTFTAYAATGIPSMFPPTTATLVLLPTGDTSSTNTFVLPGTSPVPDDVSSNSHEHKSRGPAQLGAIVGGTLGTIFVLCVITLFIFKKRRRNSLDVRTPHAFVENPGLCQCRSWGSSATTNLASSSNRCQSVNKGSTSSLTTTKARASEMIQHKNGHHCVSYLPHLSSNHKRTPQRVFPLCSDEPFSQRYVVSRSADRVNVADVMECVIIEASDLPPAYASVPRCQCTAE
ncbi:hypothetical protein BJ165DRAFT_1520420 [Panaeolus papilionaceus]|nr:hypothetical protein BJ165DRAFT_1520420 [Panaeolus papilionaceus]